MYKEMKCLRCGKTLEFVKQDNIQFGKESMFLDRDYSKGHLPVDIYICPECEEYHFIKKITQADKQNLCFIKKVKKRIS